MLHPERVHVTKSNILVLQALCHGGNRDNSLLRQYTAPYYDTVRPDHWHRLRFYHNKVL